MFYILLLVLATGWLVITFARNYIAFQKNVKIAQESGLPYLTTPVFTVTRLVLADTLMKSGMCILTWTEHGFSAVISRSRSSAIVYQIYGLKIILSMESCC